MGESRMIVGDRNGAAAKKTDRTNLGTDGSALDSPPSAATNTEKTAGRTPTPRVRSIRSRRGKRTQRYRGEPAIVEFRDGSSVPGTVVDESPSGLAIDVADKSLFRRCQLVDVRLHRVRTRAVVRYVESEADTYRVGLRLVTA
jgi:hypothetical protein